LIEKGIDVNQVDNIGLNALSWCNNYPDILKMLIEKGININ
jgi:ankyrin repeat protein